MAPPDRRRSAPQPTRRRRPARRSWLWRWRRLLFLVGLALLTLVTGVGALLASVDLPPETIQAESTILFDAGGRRLATLHSGEHRLAVTLEEIPQVVVDAVVATEDRTYFSHGGLDPLGIVRATVADLRAGSAAQGGSTITQQYVKNVYVGRDRTLWRKLREAALAVKLEQRLSKEEILERYLNTIYWGRGAHGVQAAAKAWFDRDVTELGLPEAAYLAGLIRAPESADVSKDPTEAARRRTTTLDALVRVGKITDDDAAAVEAIPLTDYVVDRAGADPQVVGGEVGTDFIVEEVRQLLLERFDESTVLGGGLRVHTTVDLDVQRAAYDAAYGLLDAPDTDPAAALVAVDTDGRIVAMVGGRDWEASKVNLAMGAAGGGSGRQAGSAFKTFTLTEAIRQGLSLESGFDSPAQLTFPGANNGEDWRVANYGRSSHGLLNLLDATRRSSNTVYAQLVQRVGPDKVARTANRMGVSAELRAIPSLTLGTSEVSPLDMASAYATLANRGVRVEPHLITRIETAEGHVLFEAEPERAPVLEAPVADKVTYVLQQAVLHGTGKAASYGDRVAGKTGTTQNFGDAWFVGYTRQLSVAVWMGFPEGQARDMGNVRGREVTGGSFPAQIFRRFLGSVLDRYATEPLAVDRDAGGTVVGARAPLTDPSQEPAAPAAPADDGGDPAATTTTRPDDY